MFNSTHTFVGFAIARTGIDEWVPNAALTAVIAANLPDIDILTALGGTPVYIELHRGITHTIIGIPLLALALAAVMHYFSGHFGKRYWLAVLVMATHPLLDYTNTYGLRPFLPFNGTWYYGDILSVFDPYIDLTFLVAMLAGSAYPKAKRVFAWTPLILVMAYIGARVELHGMAASKIEAYVERKPNIKRWAVFPKASTPFRWNGIVETNAEVLKLDVDAFSGVQSEIARVPVGAPTAVVNQAIHTDSMDTLLRFARFPVTRIEGIRFGSVGYRVLIYDFRFYDEVDHSALGAEVLLDQSLHVVKESLSFAQSTN